MESLAPEYQGEKLANPQRQAGVRETGLSLSERTEEPVKGVQEVFPKNLSKYETFPFVTKVDVPNVPGISATGGCARAFYGGNDEPTTVFTSNAAAHLCLDAVGLPPAVASVVAAPVGSICKLHMVVGDVVRPLFYRNLPRDRYNSFESIKGYTRVSSVRGSWFEVEEIDTPQANRWLTSLYRGERVLITQGMPYPWVDLKHDLDTSFDFSECRFVQLVSPVEVWTGKSFCEVDFFWLDSSHCIVKGGLLFQTREKRTVVSSLEYPYPHEDDYTDLCYDCGEIHPNPWIEYPRIPLTNAVMQEVLGVSIELGNAPAWVRYDQVYTFMECHPVVRLYYAASSGMQLPSELIARFRVEYPEESAIFSRKIVLAVQGNNVVMGNTASCAVCASNGFTDGACHCGTTTRRASLVSTDSETSEIPRLRLRWIPDDGLTYYDEKFGAKWDVEKLLVSNSKICGIFSYYSFGEMVPLIHLAKKKNKEAFAGYLLHLMKTSKRMRIKNVDRDLYSYLSYDKAFEKYLDGAYYVASDFDKVTRMVAALEERFSGLMVPRVAVNVQGPWPALAPLARAKAFLAMREFKGNGLDEAIGRSQTLIKSLPTKYAVDAAQEMKEFFQDRCLLSIKRIGESIITLDTIFYFYRQKERARMLGQIYMLFTRCESLYESARTLYNGFAQIHGLNKWIAEASKELFPIEELEEEEKEDDGAWAADAVQGVDFQRSAIWRKLAALVAASTVPEFLMHIPGFMNKMIVSFAEALTTFNVHANFGKALASFGKTVIERVVAFSQSWDWRDLFAETDADTLIVRGGELLTMSVVNNNGHGLYFASPLLAIEACEKWIKECDDFRTGPLSSTSKKIPPALDQIYYRVLAKRNGLDAALKAAKYREKEPMSYWFAGFQGTGKTEIVNDLNRFIVQFDERRPKGEDGLRPVLHNDVGTVSFDQKHWTGIIDPTIMHFNDMKGSGYVNNGSTIVIPDILRMARDICPFPTPQASLEAKDNSYADPEAVVVSSNDSYYAFSVFGNNWKKLTRRYRTVYFFAYPERYHVSSSHHLNQSATTFPPLRPEYEDISFAEVNPSQLRYYRCKWEIQGGANAGDLSLVIDSLAAVGYDNFLRVLKADYLEYRKVKPRELDSKKVCSCWTPLDQHQDGLTPCMESCDIIQRTQPIPYTAVPLDADERRKMAREERRRMEEQLKISEEMKSLTEVLLPQDFEAVSVQGLVCSRTIDTVADTMADRAIGLKIQQSKRKLMLRAKGIRYLFEQYKVHALVFISSVVAMRILIGVLQARARTHEEESEDVGHVGCPDVFTSGDVQGSVVNPVNLINDERIILRYGMAEAKAREMEQPPQYPINERVHVFLSQSSKTTTFEDVNRLVLTNWRKFRGETGLEGYGWFLDSTTLFMQTHVLNSLGRMLTLLPPPGCSENGNYLRAVIDTSRRVSNDSDETLVRIPPFMASSLWKHLPRTVGATARVSVGGSPLIMAHKELCELGKVPGFTGQRTVFVYEKVLQAGDCGTPVVANVNGSGIILGPHMVYFSSGHSGCTILEFSRMDELNKKLPGRALEVVVEPIAAVQGLSGVSRFRSAAGTSMEILGTFEKANKQGKSAIRETSLVDVAKKNLSKEMAIPDLATHGVMIGGKWNSPETHKFNGMALPYSWRRDELERAADDYLRDMPTAKLHPIPLSQQINGVEGDPLLKSMNLKTSAGIYQRFYPDKSFIISRTEINAELKQRIEHRTYTAADKLYAEHQKWCRKDELLAAEKVAVSKIRYFMATDPESLFPCRGFGGPIVAHLYHCKEFFEAYGAFNPASPEFGKMMDRMRRFAHLLMADLKHMDSSHRSYIAEIVADVMRRIAQACGYNEEACDALWNLVVAVVLSQIELRGDLAMSNEGLGSGVFFTFIFNCLVLSIMYRVAWFRISSEPFREHNNLICGGDDSCCSTDNTKFTGVFIKSVFSEYGYELTPPTAKTGAMVDFFPWEEFVFLKRSPKKLTVFGKVVEVGALATDSIWKSLGWELPSKEVSHEDRMAQVLDAGQREMALHGREKFEEFVSLVGSTYWYRKKTYEDILAKYIAGKFYDDILDARCDESAQVVSVGNIATVNYVTPSRDHSLLEAKTVQGKAVSREIGESASSEPLFSGYPERLAALEPERWRKFWRDIKANNITDYFNNKPSADVTNSITEFNLISGFSSGASQPVYSADFAQPTGAISISKILERPVSLGALTWDASTALTVSATDMLGVWKANPTVAAYLRNYKKFRGRPVLRVVSTGNPRWFGKLVVTSVICPGNDGYSNGLDMAVPSVDVGHVSQMLQMPHISLDGSAASTQEVEFPWLSPSGWYDQHQVSNRQPKYLIAFAPCCALASADAVAVGALEFELFFYLKDIELSIPCATAVQGPGVETSELGSEGTLSSKLSAGAALTGAAAIVPQLAPLAAPMSMALSGAAGVAKAMGYSSPPILDVNVPVLDKVTPSFSYTSGRQHVERLVADPKQGLAVTANAAGCGQDDDMMIASIIKRPGLIAQLTWSPSTNQFTGNTVDVGVANKFVVSSWEYKSPLSFVSRAFRYWSGSIKFRVEVVASPYHRGSFVVFYIPHDSFSLPNINNNMNEFQNWVIDLAGSRAIEFTIPYCKDEPYTERDNINGKLYFASLNSLQNMGGTASITINVYHSAGDDMDLQRPCQIYSNEGFMVADAVQGPDSLSGFASEEAEITGGGASSIVPLGKPGRTLMYWGEAHTNLKDLCSRAQPFYVGQMNYPAAPAYSIMYRTWHTLRPTCAQLKRVAAPAGTYGPKDAAMLTVASAYFEPMFYAVRGGYRFHFFLHCPVMYPDTDAVRVNNTAAAAMQRVWVGTNGFDTYQMNCTAAGQLTWSSNADRLIAAQYGAGLHLDSVYTHPVLTYEVPYNGKYRFRNSRKLLNWMIQDSADQEAGVCLQFFPTTKFAAQNFELHTSVADDWSVHCFCCVPRVRTSGVNPTS